MPASPAHCNLPLLGRSAIWIGRRPTLVGLASFAKATQGPSLPSLGVYDDVSNRTSARDTDPFGNVSATIDEYSANDANTRERIEIAPAILAERAFSRALVGLASTRKSRARALSRSLSDTFGQMANIKAGSNDKHYYIYDALGRRIVAMQIIDNDPDEDQIDLGRRRDGKHSW